ncbi:MAG TPA: cache domain-containing protein, partial [Pseudobacillus sp.]
MKTSIRIKLIVITLALLILPSVTIGISGYWTAKTNLDELGSTGLENNVMSALDLIAILNEQVENGSMTLEEAQNKAKETLIGPLQADGTRS